MSLAVDVESLAKKQKLAEAAENGEGNEEDGVLAQLKRRDEEDGVDEEEDDEVDSFLASNSEAEDSEDSESGSDTRSKRKRKDPPKRERASSPGGTSVATNMSLSPEFLKEKFPTIFAPPTRDPKVLVTTSINSILHDEARILEDFFPNATYIRRTRHAHAHKYSVKEICNFAHNRDYSTVVILTQAMHEKKPDGLDIVVLPAGPHFHFSISNVS